jgi:aminopeptidase
MTIHHVPSYAVDPVKLDRLAELAIRVGLQFQPGQDLVVSSPISATPLVRRIAVHAYKAGASVVTSIYSDDEITLARFDHGHEQSFDHAADWLYEGIAKACSNNAARLIIFGDNPTLLSNQDPAKVARSAKANATAALPARENIMNSRVNWSVVAYPDLGWARKVFPTVSDDIAVKMLADEIFAASRVDRDDAIGAWKLHNAILKERTNWLNGQAFRDLHFVGPGTDLTVGLADGHNWIGGAAIAGNGVTYNPNIPTEEVFTTPHARRVSGYVRSTKPLSFQGALIDEISVSFEEGRIVHAKAAKGNDVLHKILDIDEGARRLGEVALVPDSSMISKSGVLFYNTLFDENASSHIALGQSFSHCFVDGRCLTPEEIKQRGGNSSLIHVDWMIGSGDVDVDGLTADGRSIPVFRKGEWAYGP